MTTAKVEAVAGRQRVEDDAADHQRPMAVDLPGVGLGARAVDDGDRAAPDDLHDVVRADDPGGVLVDAETEQAGVLGDEAEQAPEPIPLLEPVPLLEPRILVPAPAAPPLCELSTSYNAIKT